MDLKGITWAGNIYHKFEAMCLEVEEVMYEDTVKYVENQVQKVGASVKKFYSEVMQDLHPQSYVDPVKVAAGELSLNPYLHTDIDNKPKSGIESYGELKKKETEYKEIPDLTAEESSLNGHNDVNHFSPISPNVLVQNTRSELSSAKSKRLGIHRRAIGIKRIPRNNCPPKVFCPAPSLSEDGSNKLVSEKAVSDESERQKKDDSECTSSSHGLPTEPTAHTGTSVENISFSQSGSCSRTSACEIESVPKEDTAPNEGKFMNDGSFSQPTSNISSNTCGAESAGKDAIVSCEDNFDIEVIESEEGAEPSVRISGLDERSKLEETCVLVEGDDLHFVPHGTEKHKSYKKKIRQAISSKLRSTRKQDQSKDLGGKNNSSVVIPAPTMGCNSTKLSTPDSIGSDWELL